MEDETRQHVVAFPIDIVVLLLNVKLAEEVKGDDRVYVDDNCQKHNGQEQLFSVVGDGLQDGSQSGYGNGHIQ